jgi:hypothetical protein
MEWLPLGVDLEKAIASLKGLITGRFLAKLE